MTMSLERCQSLLEQELTPKRLQHSKNVSKIAGELAELYGVDRAKAELAGLLHDCARGLSSEQLLYWAGEYAINIDEIEKMQPILLHASVGACLACQNYGVKDQDILSAIRCHTTGRKNMLLLDKIIFLADFIEPDRSYEGVDEVRKFAKEDLDEAVLAAYRQLLGFVLRKGILLHPSSVEGFNDIILRQQLKKQEQ